MTGIHRTHPDFQKVGNTENQHGSHNTTLKTVRLFERNFVDCDFFLREVAAFPAEFVRSDNKVANDNYQTKPDHEEVFKYVQSLCISSTPVMAKRRTN